MNYKKIYNDFINDRKNKIIADNEYTEMHHIKPVGIGGTNEKYNLIKLTFSDHIFAHLLLAKIHGGNMWFAMDLIIGNGSKKTTTRQDIIASTISRKNKAIQASINSKRQWKNETYRKFMSDKAKRQWKDDKFRTKLLDSVAKKWKEPEYIKFMSNLSKQKFKNKEKLNEYKDRLKEKWKNKDFRDFMTQVSKNKFKDEKIKYIIVESLRSGVINKWKDPRYRKMMTEEARVRMTEYMSSDEIRKEKSELMKSLWKDESFRSKAIRSGRNHPNSKNITVKNSNIIYGCIDEVASAFNTSRDTVKRALKGKSVRCGLVCNYS